MLYSLFIEILIRTKFAHGVSAHAHPQRHGDHAIRNRHDENRVHQQNQIYKDRVCFLQPSVVPRLPTCMVSPGQLSIFGEHRDGNHEDHAQYPADDNRLVGVR